MSPKWRPKDSFLNRKGRQLKGIKDAKDALEHADVKPGRRVVTSQDPGMDKAIESLPRPDLPEGFQSWQLPVGLDAEHPEIHFVTVGAPGKVVPEHTHRGDIFRIVISGSIHYNDKTLTAGHWMHVPAGEPYGYTAGPLGCTVYHKYTPPPPK